MNTPRSKRLRRVTDIAERRTDEAAGTMAECLRDLEAATRQLQELEQFRRDYALRAVPDGTGMSVPELLNRQQFVVRIDAAIAQQRREIEACSHQADQARAAWMQSRRRSMSLDTVTERYRDREQAAEERADQAAVDERMQRREKPWQAS